MSLVDISIAGRQYQIACKDGAEETLREAARLVDLKSGQALAGLGTLSEARQFLVVSLMLADNLIDKKPEAAVPPPPSPQIAIRVNAFADRLERIADMLEAEGASA